MDVLEFAGGGIARRNGFAPEALIRSNVLARFNRSPGEILGSGGDL